MQYNGKNHLFTLVFLTVFFCFLIPGSLKTADFQKVKEDIVQNSWKKIGFIYVEPSILLKNVGYNSNIYSFDEEATPDWTADAGLVVNFSALIGRRLILIVKESPYYSFFLENKGLQYFNNQISGTLHSYIGRFNLEYTYEASDMLSRPTVEFGNRIKTKKYINKLSVDYGDYSRSFVGFSARIEDLNYDDSDYSSGYDISSRLNREVSTFAVTLNRVIFTRTVLTFGWEYFNMIFDTDEIKNGSGGVLSVGIQFPEVSIIRGSFKIGMKYFSPDYDQAVKYSKPNGSGDVSIRLTKRFRLNIGYSIDNQYSFYEENQYFDLKRYTLGLDYYLGRNIKAGYSFSSGETVYKELSGLETGRKDTIEQSEFKLGVRMSGDMEIGVQYTRYFGRSSFLEFTRNYNFIGGYINHEF